jgi:hypothetical protein
MPLFQQKVRIIFQLFAFFPREMLKKILRFLSVFFTKKGVFGGLFKNDDVKKWSIYAVKLFF